MVGEEFSKLLSFFLNDSNGGYFVAAAAAVLENYLINKIPYNQKKTDATTMFCRLKYRSVNFQEQLRYHTICNCNF